MPILEIPEEQTHIPGSLFKEVYDRTNASDCLACGKCCKAIQTMFISRLDPDYKGIESFLKNADNAQKSEIQLHAFGMSITNKENQMGCRFLENNNACKIYGFRPSVCRAYPFIPYEKEINKNGTTEKVPLIVLSSACPPIGELKNREISFLFVEDFIITTDAVRQNPFRYGFSSADSLLQKVNNEVPHLVAKLLGSSFNALMHDIDTGLYGDFDVLLRTPKGELVFPIQ